jgi:hypothetical protein
VRPNVKASILEDLGARQAADRFVTIDDKDVGDAMVHELNGRS